MMKRGAKRGALSDLAPRPIDTSLRSKRVIGARSFDVHRAEPSCQNSVAGPSLDLKRAESSLQHVRALNTQFASWVQLQLQNHPDELWEDGVKDYLSHASHIMEKFKDVVDWLKTNAANSTTMSTVSASIDQKTMVLVPESNNTISHPLITNGFVKEAAAASFPVFQSSSFTSSSKSSGVKDAPTTTFSSFQNSSFSYSSKNSGLFSFSQPPPLTVLSGSQTQIQPQVEPSDDVDEENDLEQPNSPSVQKGEEKGILVVFETKCKVYVKPDNPAEKGWKDMGMGQLSIKCKEGVSRATKESKPTIVVRNEVGKVLLNALIYPGIKTNVQKNTIATIFHTLGSGASNGAETSRSEDAIARTYLLRMKTEEETSKLETAIKEYAPSA